MAEQAGFFHSVYFWLSAGSEADAAQRLAEACTTILAGIPSVLSLRVGFPARTDGPPVENSYSVALLIEFADREGHDAYDSHPEHQRFVAAWGPHFSRVQVFDVELGAA